VRSKADIADQEKRNFPARRILDEIRRPAGSS